MSETLIIFSRYPVPGKTKTRLIPALGAKGAAELQQQMTEHTLKTAIALARSRQVATEIHFAGGNLLQMQEWLGQERTYIAQVGGDLGVKMRSAFNRAFESGSRRAVIIGIDCPDLNCEILMAAFDALKTHDLALGVAEDGGYYSIGLNRLFPQLFQSIDWGTERVLKQTQSIAQQLELDVAYLPTLPDVDRPADLKIWQQYQ